MKTMTYEQHKRELLASATASYWLKEAIERLDRRDPLDALQDVEFLRVMQHARAAELLGNKK